MIKGERALHISRNIHKVKILGILRILRNIKVRNRSGWDWVNDHPPAMKWKVLGVVVSKIR